ncbi:RICIN domain-containing protein [Dactylosporangium matsuzakiense]|uniref:Beta-xylosidase n=1 Tax=Dactylosporangium matsuzakiense TaxID=53360 RepID=A0A9W6KWH6_9ACTN|nr:RICIN domain-containing protein [Dactylosporangium matsuzakiense]GLL08527.1 beta-xylosidase [Dactylosporangium matsuzakiense]
MSQTVRTRRARRGRSLALMASAAALAMVSAGFALSPASAATAATTLVVDASQTLRPVTHVATGSLYGLANASQPTVALAQAIKPNTFVQMPAGGRQQPTGDIAVVAPTAVSVGAKLVNRLSDYYPGWPYQFSWSTWTPFINSQINTMKGSSYYSSIAAYELWNESDNTWNSANGTYENFWTTTFRQVRSIDPNKPIQGPSFSDNISDMRNFLQNAVATNTVPDVLAWHELSRSSKIAGDVATVQSIEDQLGIARRPIAIEEYAAPSEVGLPGPLVGYIAKFERLGIRDAELAFWNQSGTLGDLLTARGGSPNAAYWLYTWYGAMSGNMVVTTPPAQTGIDGLAAVPSGRNQVSVIAGNCNGSCAVTVNGLNALSLGSTVSVKVEQTVSLGRTVASAGPSTVSTTTYTPSNGSITVPITMATNNAYRITITPGSGGGTTTPPPTDLAGTYRIANNNSGLRLDTLNSGTAWGTAVVQATAGSATSQVWTLVSVGNGQYKIVNQSSSLVLGIQNASTSQGATALVWGDTGTSDHLWTLTADGSGHYKIRSVNSGLVLGVTNMSTSSGAQVLQWGDSGTADHLWTLTRI